MARKWTDRPPGTVPVRLDVTPDIGARLKEIAGMASSSVAGLMRRVTEDVCKMGTIDVKGIVEELRQSYLDAAAARSEAAGPKRPRGRPRKE